MARYSPRPLTFVHRAGSQWRLPVLASRLRSMPDKENPYAGMTQSDIAAVNQAADDELEFEEHELLANEPND